MPCLNMRVQEMELPHPLMVITPQIYFTVPIFLKCEMKAASSCLNFHILTKGENFVICNVELNLPWRYLTKKWTQLESVSSGGLISMIQDKGSLLEHGTMVHIHQ